MLDAPFRRTVYIILLIALLLRAGFLVFGDVLPVMWDARRYAAGALALIALVDHSGPAADATEAEDRARFAYYNDKYIQGEQINWLAYKPHTMTQARGELFISGPLYPAALAIIFWASPVADFTVARAFGILLDLLALLLLIAVGRRLVGRTAALLAGAFYAVYFPFILASTMLLLETSTSLLILVALYCLIRGAETNSRRALIWAGLASGALVLNKPTAMLLAVPFVIGYYFYTRGEWPTRTFVNRLLWFVAPLAVVFIAWGAVASSYYGQLTLRDPEYASANLRQSTSIEFEGYMLDKAESDFWTRSITEPILNDPIGFAGLLVKKFDRLWRRPFNDFQRSFVIPYEAQEVFHLLLVVVGLLGLLMLIRVEFRHAAWPLLIVGYYTAIHLVFHSVSRYNFQAMPMLMLTAAWAVVMTIRAWSEVRWAAPIRLVVAVSLVVLGWLFSPSWINAFFDSGINETMVVLVLVLRAVLIFLGLVLAFRVLNAYRPVGRYLIPIAVTLIIGGTAASNALARNEWDEFACRLDTPAKRAGTRIYISRLEEVKNGELLAMVLDINSGAGRQNTFSIGLDSLSREYVGGKGALLRLFYPKPTYRFYAQFIPMGIEEFRQYAIVPISDSIVRADLARHGYIDIWAAINDRQPEPNNFINVYGQFPTSGNIHFIPGWRFNSIERFEHEGDPRIRYPVKYSSDSTVSYYIGRNDNDFAAGGDLSPSPGLQTGRYNIFLMHFKPDGSVLVY